MDAPRRTSQLSAHLSWTAMRRYLQEKSSSHELHHVAQHLRHCAHCSSAIVDYIRREEPQHYKLYTKKLKGILVSPQATKKRLLSSVQLKTIRTIAAVVVLLVASFFAVEAVTNQSSTHPALPSESLATIKKPSESTVARLRAKREKAKDTAKEKKKEPKKKVTEAKENKPTRKEEVKKEEVKTEKKAAPVKHQTPATPVKGSPVVAVSQEAPAASTTAVEEASPEADKPVIPVAKPEIAKVKPLSTPEKPDAAPDSRNQLPTSVPVPDHQIREE